MTVLVPTRAELVAAVQAATLAPSIHNTQPWRFRLAGAAVEVLADERRRLRVADPDGTSLRVSCGAAVFNLRLALAQQGWQVSAQLLPEREEPRLLARVVAAGVRGVDPREPELAAIELAQLYPAMAVRHSNRQPFLPAAPPPDLRARLIEAVEAEGAWLHMVIGAPAVAMVSELVRAADKILAADEAYRAELAAWTRSDSTATDGVARRSGGPSAAPSLGRDVESDPLVAVLGGNSDTPADDLACGQALQRMLLAATRHGLVASLMSNPIQVPSVREQLRIGLRRYGRPRVLVRIGFGVAGDATPRRPLAEVLTDVNPDLPATQAELTRSNGPARSAAPVGTKDG